MKSSVRWLLAHGPVLSPNLREEHRMRELQIGVDGRIFGDKKRK
jgi:hypothetical protein